MSVKLTAGPKVPYRGQVLCEYSRMDCRSPRRGLDDGWVLAWQ